MENLAEELIRDYHELVSLPEVAIRINEMVDDPSCNVEEIGRLISQDPALTVRLLGIANSPFYGFSSEISTVSRAVTVLGLKKIRNIVLSASATKAFDGIPVDVVAVDDFWQHSLYCGVLAQHLAEKTSIAPDTAFIAGLLHDIGQLILLNRYPVEMHEAILRTVEGEKPLGMAEAEQERLGANHAQVGAELARTWRLPGHLEAVMAYHHEPEKAPAFQQEVALIHIANAVAELLGFDTDTVLERMNVHPDSWAVAGLQKEDIAPAIEVALSQLEAVRHAYFQD